MNKLNLLDPDEIKSNFKKLLDENITLKIFSSVDSTNTQAKEYFKKMDEQKNQKNKKQLCVFAADYQEKGRGRRGRSWFSGGRSGLAVSFLFKTGNEISQVPLVTAAAALAVSETLAYFDLDSQIKWPNDILVSQKKIGGILSELLITNIQDAFVVIGCGINLNNVNFENEISKSATSYYLETAKKINKNIFLAVLIEKMNDYVTDYFGKKRKKIIQTWKKALNLKGKTIDFIHESQKYTGRIERILDNGDLLIILKNGQEKQLNSLNASLDYKSLNNYNYCKKN